MKRIDGGAFEATDQSGPAIYGVPGRIIGLWSTISRDAGQSAMPFSESKNAAQKRRSVCF